MFIIEDELKKLPTSPGVYIMRDKSDKIIYVGKAINLRNRVRSYFRNTNKSPRIEKMVSLIDHFEYIIVDNENEALILESNLIKENRPRFNVLLKDDKSYPFIKVDYTTPYPNVYITRKVLNDGSKYFGPYSNVGAANQILNFIKEKYKIRLCRNFKKRDRPCLNYHIGKCLAPCHFEIDKDMYNSQIKEIIQILEGKTHFIEKDLKDKMNECSKNLDFENAAIYRDKILRLEQFNEKQKVSNINENSIDVIGIAKSSLQVCIEIFFVRNSKMIGREHFFYRDLQDMDDSEIISGFISQYYFNNPNIPQKIFISQTLSEKEALESVLSSMRKHKVEIRIPKIGEKLKFVEMAENNAKITLENKEKDKNLVLNELVNALNLDFIPRKIESYDISNISGTDIVGAMCVMEDGVVKKNLSRRFIIKDIHSQNDVACMKEVITRRMKHSLSDPTGGFGHLPDLILADGGIGQIHAIEEALSSLGLSIPVYGMVKNDKHQTRALIDNTRREIEISQYLKNVITNFQDVVHDTAISFHRKQRQKHTTYSALDNIKGIGDVKKHALLKHFKSISNIKNASIEELTKIDGINDNLAKNILSVLNS